MRKILSVVMAAAMILCFATVLCAEDGDNVIAHYTFDGNKADAGLTEHGTLTYADGAVTFGADGYLTSDVDLKGLTSVSVAVKLKAPETVSGARWIFEITSQEKHNDDEHYLAAWFNNKNDYVDGQCFAGSSRPEGVWIPNPTPTDYIDFVLTYDTETHTLATYINGAPGGDSSSRVIEKEGMNFDLATVIGENPVLQLGKANWGDNGEFAEGVTISEMIVYNTALTADQVAALELTGGSTEAPTTDAPTTDAPTTDAPTTDTPAETGKPTAPSTGFATIALAIAAIGSGAYVVSKKH